MKNNLSSYVIKSEEGVPTGHPITVVNLLQTLGLPVDTRVNKSLITDNGYLPFNLIPKPKDTIRQQVQDNGLVVDEGGYAKRDYVMVAKTFEDTDTTAALNEKLSTLKRNFEIVSKRPKVDTGLGFFVDGGPADLQNFKLGQTLGLLSMIDSSGDTQVITIEDYDTVITAIQVANLELMQTKWNAKALLQAVDLQSPTVLEELDAVELPFLSDTDAVIT